MRIKKTTKGHGANSGQYISGEKGDFLPDLCSVEAVFHLVIVGELLSIALAVSDQGVLKFNWFDLGLTSIMVQWVVLSCAACLCPLRPWFRQQPLELAGTVAYALVILVTLVYTYIGTGVQTGEFLFNWDVLGSNFILAAVFAGVVLRYFYLQQQVRNQQQAELHARIQALQSRIRPHFLFNSMNSIASLIELDPPLAEKMVEDLSDLFRASLSEPGLVSLQAELSLCHGFTRIEQSRLGDRLKVCWDTADLPEHTQVPSLLIQPLLENAIYHGIQPLPEGGVVTVRVSVSEGICRVIVENPTGDSLMASAKGNGLAVENIQHRLEAYYGANAAMEVTTDDDTYQVFLTFPVTLD